LAKSNFGSEIKKQLLALNIKSPCCKRSFITGTEVFAKSRKNEFTDALEEYKARLSAKKKRAFFDEQVESSLASLTAKIQPIMLIIMGGVIGTLFIAVYSPMLSIMNGLG
jgi:hypothetical protein